MIGGIYFGDLTDNIFAALARQPYGLSTRQLIEAAYKGAAEPEYAAEVVRKAIHYFNKQCSFMRLGLRIRATNRGEGARWRIWIVRVER